MDDKEKDLEEQKTTNDEDVRKEILDKRNKIPRKSWFGQDKEQKEFHKRYSQENIEFSANMIPEEESKNPQNEEKEANEQQK